MKIYTAIGLGACLLLAGCITTKEEKRSTTNSIEEQVKAYSTFPQIAEFKRTLNNNDIVVSVRFPESWEVQMIGTGEQKKILGVGRFRDPDSLRVINSQMRFMKSSGIVLVDYNSATKLMAGFGITKSQFRTICKETSFWNGVFRSSQGEKPKITMASLNGDPAALAKSSITRERLGKKLSTTMFSLGVCVNEALVSVRCSNTHLKFRSTDEQREVENALNRFCRGIFNTVSIKTNS